MSEPKERGMWPLTDEGTELLDRCLADVRRELIERVNERPNTFTRMETCRSGLSASTRSSNAFAELAWNGFAVKPNEPEFQARWRGMGK